MNPAQQNKKPSNSDLQDMRRRMNQGPRIQQAQTTADDGVARASAAQQRADEAHFRGTNAALDSAHTRAESAQSRADAAHSRTTNAAIDTAHTAATNANANANARLDRTDGGIVSGQLNSKKFLENFTLTNTSIPAGATVSWTFGSTVNHVTMAHVADGTNGWIMLPTVGSSPVFIVVNNDVKFAIKNTRTTTETVHARIWQEAY